MGIVSQTKIADCKEEVLFEYNFDKVGNIIDEVAKEVGKHYKIPGNRPGKASIAAVKMHARKIVLDEAKQRLLNDAFKDVLHENKWKPFSQPEEKETNITFNSFSTKLTVGYIPEVTLAKYKEIELVEPESLPSKESLFDKFVENVCSSYADMKPFTEDDFVLMNDITTINFEATINNEQFDDNKGKGVVIEIGKGRTIPGFEDNIIGMKPGETRVFSLTFDEKAPSPKFVNKTVQFSIELVSAARKDPAAFDEELAKKANLENLDQLKDNINKQVDQYIGEMRFNVLQSITIDKLIELNEINVPEWMTTNTVRDTLAMQKKDIATISAEEKESLIKETVKNIKAAFIVAKIKELEVDTVLSENEMLKILEANMSKLPENIQKELTQGKNMALYSKIMNDIQNEYVIKWVIEHAQISAKKQEETVVKE